MIATNPPMTGFLNSLFNQIGKLGTPSTPITYTSRQTEAPKPIVTSNPQGNQPLVIEQPKNTLEKIISTLSSTAESIFAAKYGHAGRQPKDVVSNSQRPAPASPYVFITKEMPTAPTTKTAPANYNWFWLILIALAIVFLLRRK